MTIYLLIYLSIVNVIMNKHFSWAPTTDKLLKLSKNISLKLFKNKYNLSCFKIYCKLLKRKRFLKSIKALFGLKYLQWHGNIYRIYIYKFYKTFPKPLWHLVTLSQMLPPWVSRIIWISHSKEYISCLRPWLLKSGLLKYKNLNFLELPDAGIKLANPDLINFFWASKLYHWDMNEGDKLNLNLSGKNISQ